LQPSNRTKSGTDHPTVNHPLENDTKPSPLNKNVPRTDEAPKSAIDCDILILSDSILRKIQPKRFTPDKKTVIRYVRGGAKLCSSFVENHSHKFNPKSVLILIGTRDLTNNNVKKEDYVHLLELCTTLWKHSKVSLLPILYSKDIENPMVDHANAEIYAASRLFSSVSMIDPFHPSDDMYHDSVHLNFRKGLPAVVKHLTSALHITRERENKQHQFTQNSVGTTAKYNTPNRPMKIRPHGNDRPFPNQPNFPPNQPNFPPWFSPSMNPWHSPWPMPPFHR
jgi:hypothetical protein